MEILFEANKKLSYLSSLKGARCILLTTRTKGQFYVYRRTAKGIHNLIRDKRNVFGATSLELKYARTPLKARKKRKEIKSK